ncbi:Auxin efflux carrier transmembrane protein [Mycena kentingensis (nom. inval.)]|nr:Auxin efflux carrier transmembrane protein [Mycena kentingensis (nom. inval.)]
MLSAGYLIWISIRPIFRLIICVSAGFTITKADLFPQVAARGTGQILLNITLPSLMFSKIIPAFTAQNIGALGPLVLVAVLYEALGIAIASIVRTFFWVPHRFRWGLIVAGGWGNWGDIPNAVVMSITGAAPFNGTTDQNLGVAYVAGFIMVYMLTFFPMGGNRLVGLDYVGPDVEPDEVRETTRRRRKLILYEWPSRVASYTAAKRRRMSNVKDTEDEKNNIETQEVPKPPPLATLRQQSYESATVVSDFASSSSRAGPLVMETWQTRLAGTPPTTTLIDDPSPTPPILPAPAPSKPPPRRGFHRLRTHLRTFLRNLFLPGSLAILTSFAIALIPPLKALFVADSSTAHVHIPTAPDGQPPLAFLIDAASFIGAASVPMGLVCLGSALARLSVPRGRDAWRALPTGAILGLAVGKMLVAPVLGILLCKGLTRAGVISADDKVLQFVCMFFSCLPTATTQVFVTQVYSGTGSAEHLSAFLIPQYVLMLPAMTGVTAYTLQTLF